MIKEKQYKELSYKEKLLLNFQEFSILYNFYWWWFNKKGVRRKEK